MSKLYVRRWKQPEKDDKAQKFRAVYMDILSAERRRTVIKTAIMGNMK